MKIFYMLLRVTHRNNRHDTRYAFYSGQALIMEKSDLPITLISSLSEMPDNLLPVKKLTRFLNNDKLLKNLVLQEIDIIK